MCGGGTLAHARITESCVHGYHLSYVVQHLSYRLLAADALIVVKKTL